MANGSPLHHTASALLFNELLNYRYIPCINREDVTDCSLVPEAAVQGRHRLKTRSKRKAIVQINSREKKHAIVKDLQSIFF